jgi:hypothetical protein
MNPLIIEVRKKSEVLSVADCDGEKKEREKSGTLLLIPVAN